jgi:hypothetical protein
VKFVNKIVMIRMQCNVELGRGEFDEMSKFDMKCRNVRTSPPVARRVMILISVGSTLGGIY